MQAAEDRPPYVQFEIQAVEDRAASIAEGHVVLKDVIFAIITPQGSKDRIPRVAEEWFAQLEQRVREERFSAEWLRRYKEAYEAFKQDREPPLHGTSIRSFTVLSPAQLQTLLNFSVKTIEDLASANEETLSRIGMGARALKQKAVAWLESSKNAGAQAEQLTALRQQNEALSATVARQAEQLAELSAKVAQAVAK